MGDGRISVSRSLKAFGSYDCVDGGPTWCFHLIDGEDGLGEYLMGTAEGLNPESLKYFTLGFRRSPPIMES